MRLNELMVQERREYAAELLQEFRIKGIFYGDFYKKNSKLPTGEAKDLTKQGGIFIIGYEMPSNLLYEVWYNTNTGKYYVFDSYGKFAGIERGYSRLNDSIDEFMKFIGKEDTTAEGGDVVDFDISDNGKEMSLYSTKDIKKVSSLLKSKKTVQEFVNEGVKEYYRTKLGSGKKISFWQKYLGADIKTPSDLPYLDVSFGKFRKAWDTLFGKIENVTFIKGFTLVNRINVEVWYKKNKRTDKGTFEIIDVTNTSKPNILNERDINNLSDAIHFISEIMHVKIDEEDEEDTSYRRRR